MLRAFKLFLQRATGVSRYFKGTDLQERCDIYAGLSYYRLRSERSFAKGWYMLSATADTAAIGHNLTLFKDSTAAAGIPGQPVAHMLLGSHTHSKRLVHLDTESRQLFVAIKGTNVACPAPDVELTRLTMKFAADRMLAKLSYAGFNPVELDQLNSIESAGTGGRNVAANESGIESTVADGEAGATGIERIYLHYTQLMERHVRVISYPEWLMNRQVPGTVANVGNRLGANVNPGPGPGPGPGPDSSLNAPPELSAEACSDVGLYSSQVGKSSITLFACEPEIDVQNLCVAVRSSSLRVQQNMTILCHPEITTQLTDKLGAGFEGEIVSSKHGQIDAKQIQDLMFRYIGDFNIMVGAECRLVASALDTLLEGFSDDNLIDLVYCDHDVMDEYGHRHSPVFKPQWNPELLFSGNYIGRFFAIRGSLYLDCGGVDASLGDSQQYDLLLRLSQVLQSYQINRIPGVLYHSVGENRGAEPYIAGGERDVVALSQFFERTDQDITAIESGGVAGSLRAIRKLPEPEPSVDIVIPTRDKVDILRCCIESILLKTGYSNYRIVIVDNDSAEQQTEDYYRQLLDKNAGTEQLALDNNSQKISSERVNLLRYRGSFNFSAINNYAIEKSEADVVVLLNNDTEVCNKNWLTELVVHACRPEIGCVGAKLYYSNGLVQHAGVIVGLKGVAGHAHRFAQHDADGFCGRLKLSHNVSAVTAACLAVRRSVYQEVGGLDEVNLKVAYNDVDFCLRVDEAGYRNLWTPYAELYHHESLSRGSDDTTAKARRFRSEFKYMQQRWNTQVWQDPAYNPNLANDQEDFSLAA